jgi:hypothetical protein
MRSGATLLFGSWEWNLSAERDMLYGGPLLLSNLCVSASLREVIWPQPKAVLGHPGYPWFQSEQSAEGGRLSVWSEYRRNPPVRIFDDPYRV